MPLIAIKCIPDRFRRGSGGSVDDLPIAAGLVSRAESEERLERGVWVAPAVVAEDELVEIRLEVQARGAAVGAVQPRLEVEIARCARGRYGGSPTGSGPWLNGAWS
jgi:hypothetical protein